MTKWLTCQQACHRFASYLQWTVPGYCLELQAVLESKEDEDDGEEDEIEEGDDEDQSTRQGYSIAQHPAYSQLPIASLVEDFGAVDFLRHLTTFLRARPRTSRTARIPLFSTHLPVFKCFTVRLPPAPQVTKHETRDVIRAQHAAPAHGITPTVPAQFDTVLAREFGDEQGIEHPLDGKY